MEKPVARTDRTRCRRPDLERGRQVRQPLRRDIDQRRLDPLVGAANDATPDQDKAGAEQTLAEHARRHQPRARTHQRGTGQEPQQGKRQARPRGRTRPSSTPPEGGRGLAMRAAKQRQGLVRRKATTQRRAAALWRTGRASPEVDTNPPNLPIRPVRDRTAGRRQPRLPRGHEQDHAEDDHDDSGSDAGKMPPSKPSIKPATAISRPSDGEGDCKTGCKGQRPERVLRSPPHRGQSAPAEKRRARESTAGRRQMLAQGPSSELTQRLLSSSAEIEACLVSPTERPARSCL